MAATLNRAAKRKIAIARVRALIADAKTRKKVTAFVDCLSRLGATVLMHEEDIFGSYSKAKKLPKDFR